MSVIAKILSDFPLSQKEAELLVRSAPRRYKVHTIQKRNNRGERTIAQPTAEIKALQRLMVEEYISKLPIHSAAKAYRIGLGIADHAGPHAKNRYLLKLDFRDFFPSIKGRDLLKHLAQHSDIERADAQKLVRLLFWKPIGIPEFILSIGAPSSPAVSNTLLFSFDTAVSDFCKSKDVTYTRYADDLALSTNKPLVLKDIHSFIASLCLKLKYPRLVLNEDKTVYTSKKYRRQLTGLILTNDGALSLGREKKRLLRSMVHRHVLGLLNDEETSRLRGWLAFALSVDQAFVLSLKEKIGDVSYYSLMASHTT
jgi:RNA-directed DNA polymerase